MPPPPPPSNEDRERELWLHVLLFALILAALLANTFPDVIHSFIPPPTGDPP